MHELLDLARTVAQNAGKIVLYHYKKVVDTESKGDGSPLTIADKESHSVILEELSAGAIPVVSEEGDNLHMGASRYWLVDPLDGTKDFLAGNDEFTINIALIDNQLPVLGVIYAPALDELYAGGKELGAWLLHRNRREPLTPGERLPHCRIAVSRFHDHPDVDFFAKSNGIKERVAVGSALKYGYLASNKVDVFPRLVGSSEWDTAAGQAILEAVGGKVLNWHVGKLLHYGKAGRRNPRLLSFRAPYTYDDFDLKVYDAELL